jgi:hypothetical protein
MGWVPLAHERVQWRALVNMVMELLSTFEGREFLDHLIEHLLLTKESTPHSNVVFILFTWRPQTNVAPNGVMVREKSNRKRCGRK